MNATPSTNKKAASPIGARLRGSRMEAYSEGVVPGKDCLASWQGRTSVEVTSSVEPFVFFVAKRRQAFAGQTGLYCFTREKPSAGMWIGALLF